MYLLIKTGFTTHARLLFHSSLTVFLRSLIYRTPTQILALEQHRKKLKHVNQQNHCVKHGNKIIRNKESDLIYDNVADIVEKYRVSAAKLHNWVKQGYINVDSYGWIVEQSIIDFLASEEGKQKLNRRVNKQRKTVKNHHEISEIILAKLESCDPELVAVEYEQLLSESYRNQEGIYYTPEPVVENILTPTLFHDVTQATFCDPCCGTGNYLVEAIMLGFKPENIYGFDIDPTAIEIARKRIQQLTGVIPENIVCQDFLEHTIENENHTKGFDYVFTNPPWGKKFPHTQKTMFTQQSNTSIELDSISLFYYTIIQYSKPGGLIGLLLPGSFYAIKKFEPARTELLTTKKIVSITDYGKTFPKIMVNAVNIIFKNTPPNNNTITCVMGNDNVFVRTQDSFTVNPQHIINYQTSPEAQQVLTKIFTSPHITLKNNATFDLGIVTGDNDKHVKSKPARNTIPVVTGAQITRNGLTPQRFYINKDLTLYQQHAPTKIYEAPEKLIYKFISSNLVFAYDDQQTYTLSNANILIPKPDFPIPILALKDVLNSDFMNWVFHNVFNTHKILRKDLNELPLFPEHIPETGFNEETYIAALGIERTVDGNYILK